MAYSKTTWVDNTTPIDKDNLNKIEQGIYDNSLVVDAVTNTLNPRDTETYKTAELTEGQITDVIGVSDIVIKGQTSQDETPTPSAPVDVNVVSGSNVINTSTKNLFDKNSNAITIGYIGVNGNFIYDENLSYLNKFIKVNPNTKYTISSKRNDIYRIAEYNLKKEFISRKNNEGQSKNYTITTSNNTYYIKMAGTSIATLNSLQIEQGSTATTYEPHQGKELPLDLPVENLFDKDKVNQGDWNNPSLSTVLTLYIGKVIKGDKYTISNYNGYKYAMIVSDTSTQSSIANALQSSGTQSVNTFTFTANFEANNGYLFFKITKSNGSTITPSEINANDFQIEQGSKANAYTPYGTNPIELCKIGNYQDYFYKSGSKWYLHKKIGKIVLDGSENWSYSSPNSVFYTDVINTLAMYNSNIFCNRFKKVANSTSFANMNNGEIIVQSDNDVNARLVCKYTNYTSVADFKTWLASNNTNVYYPLKTLTDTEITDTTLISQLEAIYNAPLYEQTNITQTNNDLPMVLDVTACKDNINGIKAFIRK